MAIKVSRNNKPTLKEVGIALLVFLLLGFGLVTLFGHVKIKDDITKLTTYRKTILVVTDKVPCEVLSHTTNDTTWIFLEPK